MMMVKVTHMFDPSALKQSGVQSILCALPEIKQRRCLRKVVRRQELAAVENLFRKWRQPMLQCLGFHGSDDIQAHGRGQHAAKVAKQDETDCRIARNVQPARDCPEDWGEVSEWRQVLKIACRSRRKEVVLHLGIRTSDFGFEMIFLASPAPQAEDTLHRGQKRPALYAAGAIGHVVGREGFAKAVEFVESIRLMVRHGHEWQCRAAQLAEA
jgi:hypothetical protein